MSYGRDLDFFNKVWREEMEEERIKEQKYWAERAEYLWKLKEEEYYKEKLKRKSKIIL